VRVARVALSPLYFRIWDVPEVESRSLTAAETSKHEVIAMPSPDKRDIPKELWQIATTLTQEAQEAAVRKCQELGFDTNRGHIPLEETLINLSLARDVIVDAVQKNKLTQLPLKLQFSLLEQFTSASNQLASISGGKDSVEALEADVEDLTASIWNYQLHNLSGQVLGYETKMNQLKAQETLIRQASQEAKKLADVKKNADGLLLEISSVAERANAGQQSIGDAVNTVNAVLKDATETQQKVAAAAAQVQQNESTTTQQLSNTTQLAANVNTLEGTVKEAASEIAAARSELTGLLDQATQLIATTGTTTQTQIESFKADFEKIESATGTKLDDLIARAEKQADAFSATIAEKLDTTNASLQQTGEALDHRVTQLATDTKARLDQAESTQETKLDGQLKESKALSQNAITAFENVCKTRLEEFQTNVDKLKGEQSTKFQGLVDNLDELEGRIRGSIERATGYGLFHSFQKRQLDIEKEKKFWSRALLASVVTSLIASLVFIISLHWVKEYNAAFYLKLSISIPLIYAIAFCNVQYSRERRLEEEYAFKSNISISLDPYQRLVRQLVEDDKPEEVAKYTAFVIDSINKVFTSPTKVIFDDPAADVGSVQKLLKSVGDLVEPLVKALKK
jgi:DNA repair exonuclease SbcCD ATPase subunit